MKLEETVVQKKKVYEGKVLSVYEDLVRCPNGHLATREVIRRCEASAVLAICENGRWILEKQYRYPYDEILWEIPAGKMDAGETPLHTAIRELEEETGYHSDEMHYLGKMYPTCGYSDEVIHLFVAQNLKKAVQHLDENEALELYYFTPEEVYNMLKEGKIVDGKTICAIQFYQLWKKTEGEVDDKTVCKIL